MATKEVSDDHDDILAKLQNAETELDVFTLSSEIDDALLDASLGDYQYAYLSPSLRSAQATPIKPVAQTSFIETTLTNSLSPALTSRRS